MCNVMLRDGRKIATLFPSLLQTVEDCKACLLKINIQGKLQLSSRLINWIWWQAVSFEKICRTEDFYLNGNTKRFHPQTQNYGELNFKVSSASFPFLQIFKICIEVDNSMSIQFLNRKNLILWFYLSTFVHYFYKCIINIKVIYYKQSSFSESDN